MRSNAPWHMGQSIKPIENKTRGYANFNILRKHHIYYSLCRVTYWGGPLSPFSLWRVTMTSDRQIAANRANAQRSTGPRTPNGKTRAAQNALKHGLTATTPVLPDEDPEAFAGLRQEVFEQYNPATPGDGPGGRSRPRGLAIRSGRSHRGRYSTRGPPSGMPQSSPERVCK